MSAMDLSFLFFFLFFIFLKYSYLFFKIEKCMETNIQAISSFVFCIRVKYLRFIFVFNPK